ncbi:MAG: hypothetical protein AABY85_09440 [Gemmatimonadota bacterium]|jgi:hypothetical protein
MRISWRAALAAAFLAGTARSGRAQIDYRNLDDDRPVLLEDAYPLERHAFEFLAPWRLERDKTGRRVHGFIPEVEYGVLPNAELGVKLPVAALTDGGATDWGISGLRVFGLYNFFTEGPVLPALSLRTDVTFPVGSLGGSETHVAVKALATRSWGRNRLHLNGAYGFGRKGTASAVESAGRWWYGAAVDHTLIRHSTLLVGEVYALRAADGERVQVNASLGLRYQWSPYTVLDAGISRGLRSGLGPEFSLTFGLSRAFAVAGLMPRGRAAAPAPIGGHDARHH